jgi:hypothetical protein
MRRLRARLVASRGQRKCALGQFGAVRDLLNLDPLELTQAGWDPRTDPNSYVYLVLGPERIQVWREGEDPAGRTVMHGGEWVV